MRAKILVIMTLVLFVASPAWAWKSGEDGNATTIQSVPVPAPAAGNDGAYVQYDHGTGEFVYSTPAGAGDVSKVGTPANHEFAIWTGNGTAEGVAVTGSRAVVTDADGEPAASAVTAAEVAYLDGVTSAIQTQLNAKLATATIGAAYDTEAELDALFAAKEDQLTNEAGLYAVLSDVADFMQPADLTSTLGTAYDTEAELDALFAAKEDQLTNEAGLYAVLSDVADFFQPTDNLAGTDGQLIDLSGITHTNDTNEGLILPTWANVTVVGLTSGALAWDETTDALKVKSDAGWQSIAPTGAPTDADYLTLALDGTLSAERVLTAGAGIDFTDAGANSTLTIAGEAASVTNAGIVELATNAEADTGSDTDRAVTPAALDYVLESGSWSPVGTIDLSGATLTLNAAAVGGVSANIAADGTIEWEDAADLGADGSLSADVVAAAEMADADHGDVAWLSGVAEVQAFTVADTGDADATFYVLLVDGATGTQAAETDAGISYNADTNVMTVAGGLSMSSSTDPYILFDVTDADDTDWVIGVNADADASSDDDLEFRTSTTPGSGVIAWLEPDTGDMVFEGATDDTHSLRFDITDPTGTRVITFADNNVDFSGTDNYVLTYDLASATWSAEVAQAGGSMNNVEIEDGDGTEVTIVEDSEWKFIDGDGITINWTDVDNGTDADPFDLTFQVDWEDAAALESDGDISDNFVDSAHYAAGSIDNEHLADNAADSDEIAAGAIDLAHMSTDSVDYDNLTGSIKALTPVAGASDDFAANFTGANLYGGTYVATSDGGDAQLPALGVGMNFCIITEGDIEVVVASHANDGYLLDGTTTAEDNSIVNASTAGDIACFQYYTADDWLITTNGWSTE